ncbi:Kinase-interacting family protein [Quillaja saponaria]|uniref:Kinase-interacting family protein n=1 Tax=Quillaja saponaria TaxID=32244 RepID=A0AAD7Q5V1_QUISA|nr:Kinase-interacting family protein [Quillaja saponaria]
MERCPNLSEMKKEKVVSNKNQLFPQSGKRFCNISAMPAWLLTNLADLDERMKMLAIGAVDDDELGDTFAERAESYYQKRPQLLALLQDLYNAYIALSDRYVLTLAKKHHRKHSSQISITDHDYSYSDQEEASGVLSQVESDLESTFSYQQPPFLLPNNNALLDTDAIVTEIVIKNVEYDLLVHEVSVMDRRYSEASRKIELQKSLLEVLESERLVLLNENANLGYRVKALVEENKGLASESLFMKKKAADLAMCVLKTTEDPRVYMLTRKIEDLQSQIYGLEKKNKEYHEQLLEIGNQDKEEMNMKDKSKNRDGVALEVCLQMEKLSQRLKSTDDTSGKGANVKIGSSWWKRIQNMDVFCGLNPTCK